MAYVSRYAPVIVPTREQIDASRGRLVIEFGTDWCSYCRAAQPLLMSALAARPDIAHIKIEDGPGRQPGRSFRVRLWPTLILLRDGIEVSRIVRPSTQADIDVAIALLGEGPMLPDEGFPALP